MSGARPDAPGRWHVPGLDGLRGIAVALVLVFHTRFHLPGGFVGVDIFFVLSGYLITTLLLRELRETGGIGLSRFYVRRALRLLPVLVLVVAAATVGALVWRSGPNASETLAGILPALFYVANIARQHGHTLGWLSHTWSLAIEEQFYLLWPATLLAAIRLRHGRRDLLVTTVLGGLVVSVLTTALRFDGSAPSANYLYNGLESHGAQALLVGVGLALVLDRRAITATPSRLDLVAAGAAGLLLAIALTLDEAQAFFYRGGFLVVAVCAALVILATLHERTWTARLLGWAPLVALGRISYGLYLWHYPIYRLLDERAPDLGRAAIPGKLVLSVTVAALSFVVVERPVLRLKDRFAAPRRAAAPAR